MKQKSGVPISRDAALFCLAEVALCRFVGYYFVTGGVGGGTFRAVLHVIRLLAGELDVREASTDQPIAVHVYMLGSGGAGDPVLR